MVQDDPEAFKWEGAYAASHSDLPARVFLAAASLEPESVVANTRRMSEVLQDRGEEEGWSFGVSERRQVGTLGVGEWTKGCGPRGRRAEPPDPNYAIVSTCA